MKKFYFLFSILILSNFTIAQRLSENGFPQAILKQEFKEKPINNKVPGKILYSEDFDSTGNAARNGLPQGWTFQNNAGNTFNWIWSNTAPGGQYSTNTAALNSTSASNGFMSLPADLYNTPFPAGGPVGMDTWFVSNAISINPRVDIELKWQQSSRFCCAGADELVVEVSSDSINWTTYDAMNGRGANTGVPSPTSGPAEQMSINVAAVLANEDTAYVRFRMTGATHYYWMIDDFAITEGYADVMRLNDFHVNFFHEFTINPVFYKVPRHMLDSLGFTFQSENYGSNTQTGVRGHVSINHDSFPNGQNGMGNIGAVTNYLGIPVPYMQIDTFDVGPYIFQNKPTGHYSADLSIVTNATSQLPSLGQAKFRFELTDSVLSKVGHDSTFIGDVGPIVLWSGTPDESRLGSMHTTGSTSSILNSISMYVANVTTNIGTTIEAQVWNWNDTATTIAAAINPLLAISDSLYIDSSLLGTWITLPLKGQLTLSPNSQIVVGWEQISGAVTGAEFTVGRDRDKEAIQPNVSNFVYVNDAAQAWGWITQLAAINLNFVLPVGITEKEKELNNLNIYPNPSNGQFALRLKTEKAKQYTLKVRNNLGQIVLEEQIFANGNFAKAIDLSENESGVYFLSLENEKERLVEKIIVQ